MKGFFSTVQKVINSGVGNDYRDIYFKANPGDEHNCKGCNRVLRRSVPGEITIDHIVPQKAYGTNAITNLQVLCRSCNSKKKDAIDRLTLKYSGDALWRELKKVINY